jgi:23S rRNA pseudouridine2457 synthase
MLEYFVIYKPFGMLSQFSPEGKRDTLAHVGDFPKDVYPVGRLDADSEGLLILTNDKTLNSKLLDPAYGHSRTYLVQLDGEIDRGAINRLEAGACIRIKGREYLTRKSRVQKIEEPPLPERIPPIRFRKTVPTSWIRLSLTEGKNRQVRKMTASVGFPTLRLVRESIENLTLGDLQPGDYKQYDRTHIYELLNL